MPGFHHGELLWTHDQLATCWSGPLLADGKAWVIDEDGDLSIFALSREKQLIAEIAMNSPGYTNLAAANETLYVATKTQLVAIGSGEFPKPNGVMPSCPGVEIELVGVTPTQLPLRRAGGSMGRSSKEPVTGRAGRRSRMTGIDSR